MELLTNDDAPDTLPEAPDPIGVTVRTVTGPAVVAPVRLRPGIHLIGRSPTAAVTLADEHVEPHHVLVEISEAGVVVTAVAGRVATQVDGRPVALGVGRPLDIGTTRMRIGRTELELDVGADAAMTAAIAAGPVATGTNLVRTTRRPPQRIRMELDTPPVPRPPSISAPSPALLAASASSLAVGAVMAVVLGHLIFLVFALTGATVSGVTWVVGRIRASRAHRAHRRDLAHHDEVARRVHLEQRHRARLRMLEVHTEVGALLAMAGTSRTWERRPVHGDAFSVVVGRGEARVPAVSATIETTEALSDVPVTADLAAGSDANRIITVHGHGADAVVRSILVQLAITTGPADWSLRCLTTAPGWGAFSRLPQARADECEDTVERPVDEMIEPGDTASHRVVLVTDDPVSLTVRSSPVRTWLDRRRDVTVLVVAGPDDPVPAISDAVLHLGAGGTDTWEPDAASEHEAFTAIRLRSAGVSVATAASIATRLAPLVDPELVDDTGAGLPERCSLSEHGELDVDAVLAAWRRGGRDPEVRGVIGRGPDGSVEVDLVRDGPHGLVAGTTGSGKSELLRTLVASLAARTSPEHLHFVLVDYKGGATFDACTDLPHTSTVVTDLDGGAAERALAGLEAELRRRERLLRSVGAADLHAYRALPDTPALARLVVVIDEFAALVAEVPGFVAALVGLAQRGRSLGMHLLLATQRPAGVVDDAIRANTDLRLALRLQDAADARDVAGDASAATFPRTAPGRALLVSGPERRVVFQTASCTGDDDALGRLVRAASEAAHRLGLGSADPPWLPGPDELVEVTVGELPALLVDGHLDDAVGILDDPDAQCRRPLRWDRTGNLVMVGSLGSGTTTALIAVATRVAGDVSPSVHIGAIDARGDRGLDPLDRLDRSVGVVGLHETERLWRLLARLADVIERRRAGTHHDDRVDGHDGHEVLVIDGLGVLRRFLDAPERADIAALLDRVLIEGPAVGVFTVAALEPGPGLATVIGRFSQRWVFHLDDPADGPGLGIRIGSVPSRRPGRMVEVTSGCAGLVVRGIEPPDPGPQRPTTMPRIRTLPRRVRADELLAERGSDHDPGAATRLTIGRRHRDLGAATLEIARDEHAFVIGPPRSGRSSALATLAAAWLREHPDGSVVAVTGRGALDEPLLGATAVCASDLLDVIAGADAASPRLVIVDHAERVDDPTGRLATSLADGVPHLTVVAAARADALRGLHGHWTGIVRRSRLGLVLTGGTELDGEALGVMLPRRLPIASRPGLAWSIGAHGHDLVQLAIAEPCGISRGDRARPVPTGPR